MLTSCFTAGSPMYVGDMYKGYQTFMQLIIEQVNTYVTSYVPVFIIIMVIHG